MSLIIYKPKKKKKILDPFFDNVALLLNFDGNLNDESKYGLLPTSSSVTYTNTGKFDTACFDNSVNSNGFARFPRIDFGSGKFTIEMWVYKILDKGARILSLGTVLGGSPGYFTIGSKDNHNDNRIRFMAMFSNGAIDTMEFGSLIVNAWNHICIQRINNMQFSMHVNGFFEGTMSLWAADNNAVFPSTGETHIGAIVGLNNAPCKIDGLRITTGINRYPINSGFVVPTEPF